MCTIKKKKKQPYLNMKRKVWRFSFNYFFFKKNYIKSCSFSVKVYCIYQDYQAASQKPVANVAM